MAKNKKGGGNRQVAAGDEDMASTAPLAPSKGVPKVPAAAIANDIPLIICRNKHWRYISSFHGPWLNLPLEGLEALAHSNYNSPRPRPIDPGVFFDLVKIRRLVGEATPLTVNAANGFGPGKMKLSHERKHRMRDQATKRLSRAYHIDEIATSVAVMQGTTSLENVAELVLEKKGADVDAKYVHFFHEKIPSRHVVESTPFGPLNEMIAAQPMDPELLRTRATLRNFCDDYEGAIADLTLAIQLVRYHRPSHNKPAEAVPAQGNGRRAEVKLAEIEQPTSLEMQLVFQRGTAYLSRACQFVDDALPPPRPDVVEKGRLVEGRADEESEEDASNKDPSGPRAAVALTPAQQGPLKRQFESRKTMKMHAKRALRDYITFLDHLEYSPNFLLEDVDEMRKSSRQGSRSREAASHRGGPSSGPSSGQSSPPAPTIYKVSTLFESSQPADLPAFPPATAPTEELRQQTSPELASQQEGQLPLTPTTAGAPPAPKWGPIEYTTYHPLLTDALHALLLCHSLLGTSAKELQRHAYMVARLTRLADGYPVFQASRSPSRADWMEAMRLLGGPGWLQLPMPWEALCRPPPGGLSASGPRPPDSSSSSLLPPPSPQQQQLLEASSAPSASQQEQPPPTTSTTTSSPQYHQHHDNQQQQQQPKLLHLGIPMPPDTPATATAVANARRGGGGNSDSDVGWRPLRIDPRIVDQRMWNRHWNPNDDDGREYPIITERAAVVARWVRESPSLPPLPAGAGGARKKKKRQVHKPKAPPPPGGLAGGAGAGAPSDVDDEDGGVGVHA